MAEGRSSTPARSHSPSGSYDAGEHTVQQIADIFSVPRTTVYGHLDNGQGQAPRLASVADGAGRRVDGLSRRRISAVGGW